MSTQMGRPRKEIDFKAFEGLCKLQCTLEEIAGFFDVSADTIERRVKENYGETFADIYKIYASPGLISLRRTQFKMAEKSPAMAIFLGKVYLGQSDKMEIKTELTGRNGGPVKTENSFDYDEYSRIYNEVAGVAGEDGSPEPLDS